jgi:L,D-peptidoglycan transpeptidase YkuD (ErfK/YbiS/YcfS/YnhG family)
VAASAALLLLCACGQQSATTAQPVGSTLGAAAEPDGAADLRDAGPAHPTSLARPAATQGSATPRPTVPRVTPKPATPPPRVVPTAPSAQPSAHANRLPFPVPVSPGSSTEVITVKASGTWASVVAWSLGASGWVPVISTTSARIGANGLVNGLLRHQGTDTTPTGTYTLTQAFGIRANPGTALPYHLVTNDDWWVEDNNSAYYNSMRGASQGGFNTSVPENSVNGSEHLIRHVGQYDYAVVINYNMSPAVHYRGAGIFLHESDGYPTAGCVAVPAGTIVALLQWLKPAAHPLIVIG